MRARDIKKVETESEKTERVSLIPIKMTLAPLICCCVKVMVCSYALNSTREPEEMLDWRFAAI